MSKLFYHPTIKLLKNLILLLLFLGGDFGLNNNNNYYYYVEAFKVPFRVKDVLPVLPHQISWPVLNNLHSAVDLLPYFVGTVSPDNGTLQWKGACFYDNEASLDFTLADPDHDPALGGGLLRLKTSAAHSWTCMDLYVFATPYRVTWDYYFSAREHTLKFDYWEEAAEMEYVI